VRYLRSITLKEPSGTCPRTRSITYLCGHGVETQRLKGNGTLKMQTSTLLSIFHMGLMLYYTSIYYGPWNLFNLRPDKAQQNSIKKLAYFYWHEHCALNNMSCCNA
jgi:hypothetical protein